MNNKKRNKKKKKRIMIFMNKLTKIKNIMKKTKKKCKL